MSGTASNADHPGGLAVAGATLTITDDDSGAAQQNRPAVTLQLSRSAISEAGGRANLTAVLSETSTAATAVTVTGAPAAGYRLSGDTLLIAAGQTRSAGIITITAADNRLDAPDLTVTLSGAAANPAHPGGLDVTGAALTITDDDTPAVTLSLSPQTISERGGVAFLSARQSVASSATTTIAVNVQPQSPATADDYTLSGGTLTIPPGQTASQGRITITANDNAVDAPDKQARISGLAANANNQAGLPVAGATLIITDDETPEPAPIGIPTPEAEPPGYPGRPHTHARTRRRSWSGRRAGNHRQPRPHARPRGGQRAGRRRRRRGWRRRLRGRRIAPGHAHARTVPIGKRRRKRAALVPAAPAGAGAAAPRPPRARRPRPTRGRRPI